MFARHSGPVRGVQACDPYCKLTPRGIYVEERAKALTVREHLSSGTTVAELVALGFKATP